MQLQKGFTPLLLIVSLAIIITIGFVAFNKLRPQSIDTTSNISITPMPSIKKLEGTKNSNSHDQQPTYPIMQDINVKRRSLGYKELMIDDNLCKAAQLAADESERIYPEELTSSISTTEPYATFTKAYGGIVKYKMTISDTFVEAIKKQGKTVVFDDESLLSAFTTNRGVGDAALTQNLTHGCYGVSSGTIGYKPFAYFIGGIK